MITTCRLCCSGESAAAAFRDLNKLSRVFKDQVAYPLIAAAREGKDLDQDQDQDQDAVLMSASVCMFTI